MAAVHSYDLSLLSGKELSATNGSLLVDLDVPQGGFIALRKMGQQPAEATKCAV